MIEKFNMLQAEMKSQKIEINQLKYEINDVKSGNVELKYENGELKARLSQQSEQLAHQNQKIILLEKENSKQKSFGPPNQPTDSCKKMVDNVASEKNKRSHHTE